MTTRVPPEMSGGPAPTPQPLENAMQRMTGIDPMFVYSDTPATPMEIAYVCVFDPATATRGYSFGQVADLLEARIPALPALRRRLMAVPLGLDHPRWVDDPDYDLADHLHRVALPSPGGTSEFGAKVAEVMGRPLTSGQPPWEMHVLEGLEDGRIGLIAKVHHAVIDGVAGAQMLARLLDLTPEGSGDNEPVPPWIAARLPSPVRLAADALPSMAGIPLRALRAAREVGSTAVRLARDAIDDRTRSVAIPLGAPTTFETPVCARRAVAFAQLELARVRAIGEYYSSTVNDVVLAVCAGALRSHLAAQGHEVDSPLVAVVPVSVRADSVDGESGPLGNQLSAMFVPLASDRRTPLERLRATTAASTLCKGHERRARYGQTATLVADAIPPMLARPLIQLGVRAGVLRKLRTGNLMVSNVPGPAFPLYFAGMELCGVYPLGPVVDGVALNITVQSYRDTLFVGINACATTVEDLPGLAAAMVEELDLLATMAPRTSVCAPVSSSDPRLSSAGAGPGRPLTPAPGNGHRSSEERGSPLVQAPTT